MRAAKITALSILLAQLLPLGPSSAADYPSRPIKLLVGASAGGTTDTMARTIAQPLSSLFGVPVLVENRPGAGGNIAAEAVARDVEEQAARGPRAAARRQRIDRITGGRRQDEIGGGERIRPFPTGLETFDRATHFGLRCRSGSRPG